MFNDIIELGILCNFAIRYNTGVKFINEIQEYIVFCSEETEMKFFNLIKILKLKDLKMIMISTILW